MNRIKRGAAPGWETAGGSADSHTLRYRPDIDGLRAVAVLSVVFFHLSRSTLKGGYLGVDMFFVLSGFLITSIIWREIQLRNFSILRFYDRRIRRILPALLAVLFLTTIASTILLLPSDLVDYSRSLIATVTFVANIYFWRDTDYFSGTAEEKPLLHMWSLGVEEQFYIFFPLLLVLLARFRPRVVLYAIAALSIVSFAANMLAIHVGGASPAFFLLPTRAWELGLGAFIALLPAQAVLRASTANVVASIGAVLVIAGILYPHPLTPSTPIATPVVVGTTLLVLAGRHRHPIANRLLSQRVVVFAGVISYSLYLWHWPVFVFMRYYTVGDLNLPEMAAAMTTVALCAIVSWRFVERPFRSKRMPAGTILISTGSGAGLLAAVAVVTLFFQGFPNRFDQQAAAMNEAVGTHYRCPVSQYMSLGLARACPMHLPSRDPADAEVVLLGNSHAQMYAPAWTSIFTERGVLGLLVPVNSCLPTVRTNISRECIEAAQQNLKSILALPRVRTVILAFDWWHGPDALIDPKGGVVSNLDNAALSDAIDDLDAVLIRAGKHVVLIGPIAMPGWPVASTMSRQHAFGWPEDHPAFLPKVEFEQRFNALIQHFEADRTITFVPVHTAQCLDERCYYVIGGRSLYSDDNHIAAAQLYRFRPMFEAAYPAK